MKILKKVGSLLLDFVEVVMPVAALLVIFVSFIANVISRYVANAPINACYELCLAGLVWCLLLSTPNATRKHGHVMFTLVYDSLGAKGQLIFRLIGNAFLVFIFAVMLYPCADWVMFMGRRSTTVLKIPLNIIHFPFIVCNVLCLFHLACDLLKDVMLLVKVATGKASLKAEVNEGGAN